MESCLLIRLPDQTVGISENTEVSWRYISAEDDVPPVKGNELLVHLSGHLSELTKTKKEGCKVVVFLPDTMVSHQQISVTKSQIRHLDRALPYLVEEDKADDIADLHLASVEQYGEGLLTVAAITHSQMRDLLEVLHDVDLSPDHIVPESQLIPSSNESISLYFSSDQAWAAMPGRPVISVGCETLELVIVDWLKEASLRNEEGESLAIKIYNVSGDLPVTPSLLSISAQLEQAGWSVQNTDLEIEATDFLIGSYKSRSAEVLDLLTGPYFPEGRKRTLASRWKPYLLMLFLVYVAHIGIMSLGGFVYGTKAGDFWQKSAAYYLGVFPNDKQVVRASESSWGGVNIRSRLESRLKAPDQGADTLPLVELLHQVSSTIGGLSEPGLKTIGFDYNRVSGRLTMEMRSDALAGMNKFLSSLKEEGFNARMESADKIEEEVRARVVITI
ncbi:MAG: type II secretion system protein GspL [Endozoicomonas sp.]|uniref:type II secretion system protein GspL n=1 Tax=Endozoicomonas sp. TaxID=1892382 RepID=UPI003D9B183C